MATPRVMILRAPGTNCDLETAYAFERAGASAERVHIRQLLDEPQRTEQFQIVCIPGGFSYGDDIAAGQILAVQIRHHLYERLREFHRAGKLILGVCNGFQVLIKSRILLEEHRSQPPRATLTWNDLGRFEDRWVHLAVGGRASVWLEGLERLYLPVAHAEGKFVASSPETLDALDQAGQLVLRYAPADAGLPADPRTVLPYPLNPNGSQANVAGVSDPTGRVLGLMPHPERYVDSVQHPRWTRGEVGPGGDGLALFQNAVRYFRL